MITWQCCKHVTPMTWFAVQVLVVGGIAAQAVTALFCWDPSAPEERGHCARLVALAICKNAREQAMQGNTNGGLGVENDDDDDNDRHDVVGHGTSTHAVECQGVHGNQMTATGHLLNASEAHCPAAHAFSVKGVGAIEGCGSSFAVEVSRCSWPAELGSQMRHIFNGYVVADGDVLAICSVIEEGCLHQHVIDKVSFLLIHKERLARNGCVHHLPSSRALHLHGKCTCCGENGKGEGECLAVLSNCMKWERCQQILCGTDFIFRKDSMSLCSIYIRRAL